MISASVDQLLKSIVPRNEDRLLAAVRTGPPEPPFEIHLRQAESDQPSTPVKAPAPAETSERDHERRSTDVEPPASHSAEDDAPPPTQNSAEQKPDDSDQREATLDDSQDDAQQHKPAETADAPVAAAASQPTIAIRADAITTAANGTLAVEPAPAEENPLLAEHSKPHAEPAVEKGEQVVDSVDRAIEDEAAATEGNFGDSDVEVDSATIEDALADRTKPNLKPIPNVAHTQSAGRQFGSRPTDAAETVDAPRKNVIVAQGEQTDADQSPAAPNGLAAANVDADDADADPDRTVQRRVGRLVREAKSSDHVNQSRPVARQAERGGDRPAARNEVAANVVEEKSAPDTVELDPENSVVKSDGEVDDEAQRDEQPTDTRQVSSRPRSSAGARPTAVPTVVAAAAAANLTEARADASSDAATESDAKNTPTAAKDSLLTTFGRFDRNHPLGGRAADGPGRAPEAPHVDPARFVTRVARAIHTAQERGGPLQLRLSPPELGSLRLELSVKQGVLTASVETDTATARQVLLDNLPALRDRLAEHNVRIERFDVDVRRDGGEQPRFGPQHQDHQQPRHAAPNSRVGRQHGPGGDAATEPAPLRRTITDTSINVIA